MRNSVPHPHVVLNLYYLCSNLYDMNSIGKPKGFLEILARKNA